LESVAMTEQIPWQELLRQISTGSYTEP
jgi:hypothetical protein